MPVMRAPVVPLVPSLRHADRHHRGRDVSAPRRLGCTICVRRRLEICAALPTIADPGAPGREDRALDAGAVGRRGIRCSRCMIICLAG